MPQKTIYVKEADLELWKRAQEELGESISSIFSDCLRERLEQKMQAPDVESMEKIQVWLWSPSGQPTISKTFIGEWLIAPHETMYASKDDGEEWPGVCWAIAQTKKGLIAVHSFEVQDRCPPTLDVYRSIESLGKDVPESIIAETADRLGVVYEVELDV